MKSKDPTKASYAVGYGKPPVSSRFTKGNSGNPSGKLKGTTSMKNLFEIEGAEQIAITENGVSRKISKREAVVKSIYQGALKGNVQSANTVLSVLSSGDSGAGASSVYVPTDADIAALQTRADFLKLIEDVAKEQDDEQSN